MEVTQEQYMYKTIEKHNKRENIFKSIIITALVLLIGLGIFTIWYVVEYPAHNQINESNKVDITECTSPSCIALANEILSSINSNIDPCHDFYEFACDGWVKRHSWGLTTNKQFSQFDIMDDNLKHV